MFILVVKVLNSDARKTGHQNVVYTIPGTLSETSLDNAPSPLFILVASGNSAVISPALSTLFLPYSWRDRPTY
jgi:hypothetical protein